ncbi:hypothetical protein HPB50_007582 [Hyalomma asiaticum]|uniref:Uncharacterized protein n=1 Tax=Hyalomma asiaticum TaxID=266040 RepID=A0ACB7SL31_HYAAI|nr:hypothetical protein HPB50_007582 [Hyalomma asiaticum]
MKRIITTGSVQTASAVEAAWEAFDCLECLLNLYGMTESCAVVTGQPKFDSTRTGADCGFPNANAMIKRALRSSRRTAQSRTVETEATATRALLR